MRVFNIMHGVKPGSGAMLSWQLPLLMLTQQLQSPADLKDKSVLFQPVFYIDSFESASDYE